MGSFDIATIIIFIVLSNLAGFLAGLLGIGGGLGYNYDPPIGLMAGAEGGDRCCGRTRRGRGGRSWWWRSRNGLRNYSS